MQIKHSYDFANVKRLKSLREWVNELAEVSARVCQTDNTCITDLLIINLNKRNISFVKFFFE